MTPVVPSGLPGRAVALIAVGLLARIGVTNRPRQPLDQWRPEMLALGVGDGDPLAQIAA